jgi:hypothetical protein
MSALLGDKTECLFCYKKRRKVRIILTMASRIAPTPRRPTSNSSQWPRSASSSRRCVGASAQAAHGYSAAEQVDDDPAAATYAREAISLFHVTRRPAKAAAPRAALGELAPTAA